MTKRTSTRTNREVGDQLDVLVEAKYAWMANKIGSDLVARRTINSGAIFGDLDVQTLTCSFSDKTQSCSKNFIVKKKELAEVMDKSRKAGKLPILVGKSQDVTIAVIPLDDFLGLLVDYEKRVKNEIN